MWGVLKESVRMLADVLGGGLVEGWCGLAGGCVLKVCEGM